ncbi:MAG: menaquinone biosynthesis protein [Chthoniobacteraceae bacterium]
MAEALAHDAFRAGKARPRGVRVNRVDPWLPLRGLRIGCVKYLNSRPLICAYDGPVLFEHPSALARMLAAGELDAALVPVFEVVRAPHYTIVDDVAVGCDGAVFSVVLAYRGALRDVRSIASDPASLSSLNLAKILLAEFHGIRPVCGADGDARLIIGNQAIEFRLRSDERRDGWNFLDLGEEWKRCTGLPFVFAVWALRPGTAGGRAIADAFRLLKKMGTARIPEIIATDAFADEETRRRYLTEFLSFDIGPGGKAGMERYRELLSAHGLIGSSAAAMDFV